MTTETETQVRTVKLEDLEPAPDNLRGKIDGNELNQMVKSMESHGLLEPILVHSPTDNASPLQIVAGHRRYEAAKKLGWDVIPAIVKTFDDDERTEIMLIENLQRVDLTPVEEARGYFRLVERGMTIKTLADRIGRSQKHVSGRLRLIEAPHWLQLLLDQGDARLSDVLEFLDVWRDGDDPLGDWMDQLDDERRQELESWAADNWNGARWIINQLSGIRARERQEQVMAQVREKAEKAGFEFVEKQADTYGQPRWPAGTAPLDTLGIKPKDHRAEPCHALGVESPGWNQPLKAIELCTKRSRHTAKGSSPVKPDDIEAQTAKRQEEKQRREEEKQRRVDHLRAMAEVSGKMKAAEANELLALFIVEDVYAANDAAVKELLQALDVDWKAEEDGDSANGRQQLLLDQALSSKAATRRVATLWTLLRLHSWSDITGRIERSQELIADLSST